MNNLAMYAGCFTDRSLFCAPDHIMVVLYMLVVFNKIIITMHLRHITLQDSTLLCTVTGERPQNLLLIIKHIFTKYNFVVLVVVMSQTYYKIDGLCLLFIYSAAQQPLVCLKHVSS